MTALIVPEPLPNDPEDLSTALETAAIFGAQGDAREAVRWVRRAAELAGDAGDDMRALALARAVADLGESVAPSKAVPEAPEPAVAAPAPAPAEPPPAKAEEALPPPPPLPDRAPPAVLTDGDRITNPGIAPPSTPSAARITQTMAEPAAVSSRPASVPPPTANEDAGWSDADSEPQTPPPTNGAAAAPAPVVPTAPALDGAPALSTPVHQAVRVSVEATTETGVFRVTALGAGESAEAGADEALLVLLDPKARLDS